MGLLGNLPFDQWSAHKAGTDHIGADAVGGALLGHRPTEPENAMLGGNVGSLERRGQLAMHRAEIEDAGAARLAIHLAQTGAGGQKGAIEMHSGDLAPVVETQLIERFDMLDAGVGHGDVEAPPLLYHGSDTGIHSGLISDIHGNRQSIPAVLADYLGGLLGGFQVKVGNRYLGALASKALGDGQTNAADCASDQSDFVLHTHG